MDKPISKERCGKVYLALLHHPVLNKNGDVVITALTNLDVHDIARAAKTYGVYKFYVVTPSESQHRLLNRILAHWTSGFGGEYNPTRKAALELVSAAYSLDEVKKKIADGSGKRPLVVLTSAKKRETTISLGSIGKRLAEGQDLLLVFGTGWGLAKEVHEKAHFLLEPICGVGEYNHLSVRSAVSIILDRLFGR